MKKKDFQNRPGRKMESQLFGHMPLEYVEKLSIQNPLIWQATDRAHTF